MSNREDCFILLLGEPLERWSQQQWFAPLHYVPLLADGVADERLTVAFFHNPDYTLSIPHPVHGPITVQEHWWMLFNRNRDMIVPKL